MTIHQYLMQASKDDARRADERDRVLLEALGATLVRALFEAAWTTTGSPCGTPRATSSTSTYDRWPGAAIARFECDIRRSARP